MQRLGAMVFPAGGLWVAWPKRSSGLTTDVTDDGVRAAALPLGLVDNKVCAIDATWTGLRLVWRQELPGSPFSGAIAGRQGSEADHGPGFLQVAEAPYRYSRMGVPRDDQALAAPSAVDTSGAVPCPHGLRVGR